MLIVIEGLDGSGKSTQLGLLQNYLSARNIQFEFIHFPRLESPLWGELIARFLRGEFGENNKVDPYLVALLYALDRNDAKEKISNWIREGKTVILDRYVNSNIAYQCAKIHEDGERKKLSEWILNLEYSYYKLPKPDLNIFLDVPFSFVENKLNNQRSGEDRSYLNGAEDIHEKDLNFQQQVKQVYHSLIHTDPKFKILNCTDDNNKMLSPDTIFEKIKKLLLTEKLIAL